MRRPALALLLSVLLPALLLAAPGSAAADDRAAAGGRPAAPLYLALGDSVAAGAGAPGGQGYVPLLAAALREGLQCPGRHAQAERCPGLELVNLSRPGATSASLIAEQLPAALVLAATRNWDHDRRNDVAVITITIGGNDIFTPVLAACVERAGSCQETVGAVLAAYRVNLLLILAALRTAAGPHTTIVTTAYDNPLPACELAAVAELGDVVLEGGVLPAFELSVRRGFNDITERVSRSLRAEVADAFGKLAITDFVGGRDCLHPDASGHQRLAEIFADVIL